MKKMIFAAILISMIALSACTKTGATSAQLKQSCEGAGGTWLEGSLECEGISKATCDSLGGNFNECASACRNNPGAQVCTLQCVIVCSFKK